MSEEERKNYIVRLPEDRGKPVLSVAFRKHAISYDPNLITEVSASVALTPEDVSNLEKDGYIVEEDIEATIS